MNGFITRMANVLIGFDDRIVMKMRPSELIQARIPAAMARLRTSMNVTEGDEPFEFWSALAEAAWTEMDDVELPLKERDVWLQTVLDPALEQLVQEITKLPSDTNSPSDPIDDIMKKYSLGDYVKGIITEAMK